MTRPTLMWKPSKVPQVHEAVMTYRPNGRKMPVYTLFSIVRPARAGDGLLSDHLGWVVTTNSFCDVMHFATLEEAKRHVEAIFALNYG